MTTTDPRTRVTRTRLRAEGFTCPSCVATIDKRVRMLPGVHDVAVHFASSRIEVDHDPGTTVEQIVDAIAEVGYTARPTAF